MTEHIHQFIYITNTRCFSISNFKNKITKIFVFPHQTRICNTRKTLSRIPRNFMASFINSDESNKYNCQCFHKWSDIIYDHDPPIPHVNMDKELLSKCLMYWWNRPNNGIPGGRFKNTYELLNLRALKISKLHKNHIFQCMGKIFCVEFQRVPLKFHTKYRTHTLKDVDFIHIWKFKSS